jgi:hypothetical protein
MEQTSSDMTMEAQPEVRSFEASPRLDQWAAAFAQAQGELPTIAKDKTAQVQTKTGGSYAYSYANLATILHLTRPVLAKHGLAVTQLVTGKDRTTVVIKTILFHKSGQWVAAELPMPVGDGSDPQKVGSALSYGRRYGYAGIVGVAAEDEDDDARLASQKPVQRKPAPTRATTSAAVAANGNEPITTTNSDGTVGGQKGRLLGILEAHRVDKKAFGAHLREKYGVETWSQIKQRDFDDIVALAQAWPVPAGREPGAEG